MSEETHYTPIDCSLHDELLALTTLRKGVTITYLDEKGRSMTIHSIIEDVYTKGQAEFLRTKEGTVIRLDRLLRVDESMVDSM